MINWHNLSKEDKLKYLDLLQQKDRHECTNSFSKFFKQAWNIIDPGLKKKWNWHIDLISEYLEAAANKEIQKLIINIPPRSLKSNLCTVAFPAWLLAIRPDERIMCASYSSNLAIKHSVDSRLIIESDWYKRTFPNTILSSDQNTKHKFQTTERGQRVATSVGGSATGDGGNYLISDDYLNPKMAMSKTERNSSNDWMDQTWSSRKNDPKTAVEIVVMQRLHTDDVCGRSGDDWQEAENDQVITFPSGKIKTRIKGELLHTDRVGINEVADFKNRLGSYGYASQQQQRPAPQGGGIVKIDWFRRYKTPPALQSDHKIIFSVDSANKDKDLNDPSVIQVWQINRENYYLIFQWKERVIYPDLKHTLTTMIEKYRPNQVLIEDKASGQQLLQDLRRDTHFPVKPMEPSGQGDKIVRMSNESPVIESGSCWLPESAPWLFDYEYELQNFPNAEHDDQVDATSQFLRHQREYADIFVG